MRRRKKKQQCLLKEQEPHSKQLAEIYIFNELGQKGMTITTGYSNAPFQ